MYILVVLELFFSSFRIPLRYALKLIWNRQQANVHDPELKLIVFRTSYFTVIPLSIGILENNTCLKCKYAEDGVDA